MRSGTLLPLTVATVLGLAAALGACTSKERPRAAPSAVTAAARAVESPPRGPLVPLTNRSGSALARSPSDDALYLADEDHQALRRFKLPIDLHDGVASVPLPGRPAQILAFADRVLVTVRDPGLVLELAPTAAGFTELRRVKVPADAWGLAVTADQRIALVSSAWTHRVSAIDLATMTVRWSVDVAREPRGIAITAGGTAFISHLVGSDLTRIDALDAPRPNVTTAPLAAGALRAMRGTKLGASLGYAPVLSPSDARLFVPRHALGAIGVQRWFGTPTVDVMLTASGAALSPPRSTATARWEADQYTEEARSEVLTEVDGSIAVDEPPFTQPRAAVYRPSTDTLLVASEGSGALSELDALALDPSMHVLRQYPLVKLDPSIPSNDPHAHVPVSGGAPSAVALSKDESTAFVYARSTNDLLLVHLGDREGARDESPMPIVHIVDDTLSADAIKGKRLFYDATDETMSGGLGCAGCHPEGRDDGFVWGEFGEGEGRSFRAMPRYQAGGVELGLPRQTPMLAGRVSAEMSYGWHGESRTITDRVRDGFGLHRWAGGNELPTMDRPKAIVAFLREGLVPPARDERPLTDQEQSGRAIFESDATGCTTCHDPKHELTDRTPRTLARELRVDGFLTEKDKAFKTPSLFYVGGTPPYFHDGAARTLEDVVDRNGDAMGHTSQLTATQRAALVAYLRTL